MLKTLAKLINGEIALGFYLATVLWIGVVGYLTSYRPTTAEQKDCYESAAKSGRNTRECESFWEKTTSDPIAFFTLVLAFSTIGMWVGTIGLYRVNRAQIDLARDEFRSTHRPKIRLKHIWLNSDIWKGQPIIVTLVCVNTGTAEARLQEIGIRYEIVSGGEALPAAPDIAAVLRAGGAVVRCGLNFRFPLIDIGRVLTAFENVGIQQKRAQLYCVGYISYLDAADRLRITGFCRVLEFPANSVATADNTRFRVFDDPDYEYED